MVFWHINSGVWTVAALAALAAKDRIAAKAAEAATVQTYIGIYVYIPFGRYTLVGLQSKPFKPLN